MSEVIKVRKDASADEVFNILNKAKKNMDPEVAAKSRDEIIRSILSYLEQLEDWRRRSLTTNTILW